MPMSEIQRSQEAATALQQLNKERRASLGRKAAAGAAGAVLAGALTVGLMKLLSKKGSNNGGESRKEGPKEVRRTTRLGPGGLAYKKGGVAKKRNSKRMKKKVVKKAARKAVHKKAGKR